jgi:hypothetical protein
VVVKTLLLLSLATFSSFGQVVQVPPRQIVPMEVQLRAKDAVQVMVNKTLQQDFVAVAEMMNPEYLKILARTNQKTVNQIKAQAVQTLRGIGTGGVSLEAMITLAPQGAFEVDYGFEDKIVNGEKVKVAGYRSWMVFIPTVVDFSGLDEKAQPPRVRTIRQWSFQVAISKKDKEAWTFISGDSVNALELRKLFKFLPQEDKQYNFPVRKLEEVEIK